MNDLQATPQDLNKLIDAAKDAIYEKMRYAVEELQKEKSPDESLYLVRLIRECKETLENW